MISRKAPLRHSPVDREAIESWLDRPPRVRGPNLVARGRSRREAQFQIHRFTATATVSRLKPCSAIFTFGRRKVSASGATLTEHE